MISISIQLLKSRRLFIPAITLLVILCLLAFISYWVGAYRKELTENELASYVSIQATQSTLLALFALLWIIQNSIHLYTSGFYKSLLSFGWKRDQLFFFILTQLSVHIILFLLLNFASYCILSFFYGLNPMQLVVNTDYNALIFQILLLFIMGVLGVVISFLKKSQISILPVFLYWIFEGWLGSFLQKQTELNMNQFLPLGSLKLLVGEQLLSIHQLAFICLYSFLIYTGFYLTIQKRMFL